jgi:hypothetical protein
MASLTFNTGEDGPFVSTVEPIPVNALYPQQYTRPDCISAQNAPSPAATSIARSGSQLPLTHIPPAAHGCAAWEQHACANPPQGSHDPLWHDLNTPHASPSSSSVHDAADTDVSHTSHSFDGFVAPFT